MYLEWWVLGILGIVIYSIGHVLGQGVGRKEEKEKNEEMFRKMIIENLPAEKKLEFAQLIKFDKDYGNYTEYAQ